ncbi:hypothetical protein HBE96_00925 [Clostridium sp. P21]|uniref:DUF8042 domain-containing protein n=1 Tax=Clostridium muellerianum TaxID=2716538 RepID=A0A7Y0EF10_9CLOT|nr:hypothetical protein [Clostridium muellerianum]NMM61285.1 hypothetical protein [Clostridium muellerianum]
MNEESIRAIEEFKTVQRDTMPLASEYVAKLKNGVDMAINKFQSGENEEGINLSSYIEEGLQWLIEVARLTKDVQYEEMSEELMSKKLDMFVDAYENKDYTLMGDVLEFEIKPLLESWEKVINAAKC